MTSLLRESLADEIYGGLRNGVIFIYFLYVLLYSFGDDKYNSIYLHQIGVEGSSIERFGTLLWPSSPPQPSNTLAYPVYTYFGWFLRSHVPLPKCIFKSPNRHQSTALPPIIYSAQ